MFCLQRCLCECAHLDLFLRRPLLGSEEVASSRKITSAALDFDMVNQALSELRASEGGERGCVDLEERERERESERAETREAGSA